MTGHLDARVLYRSEIMLNLLTSAFWRCKQGLDRVAQECPDALVFHAGVKEKDGELVTGGGRVMTVVGKGPTFEAAIARAYEAASRVRFDGMQYRRDIGRKAL